MESSMFKPAAEILLWRASQWCDRVLPTRMPWTQLAHYPNSNSQAPKLWLPSKGARPFPDADDIPGGLLCQVAGKQQLVLTVLRKA